MLISNSELAELRETLTTLRADIAALRARLAEADRRGLAMVVERDKQLAEATPIIAGLLDSPMLYNRAGPTYATDVPMEVIQQARAYTAKYGATDAPVPVGLEDFAIGAVNEPRCDECGEFLSECECEPEWDIPQADATDTERR